MSNRPDPLSAGEQADIGRVALALRAAGVPWKTVEDELGLCERHLRRCIALAGDDAGAMSEISGRMSDLAA